MNTKNGWHKHENENGFPFYINDGLNIKQWDHPTFCEILQRLDESNFIKYSSYRLASKIRTLQSSLCMEDVSLSTVSGVFERHKLGITEGTLCLESYDIEAVLSDIYFATNKKNHTNIDVDLATELMINFLYNVYDKDRLGKIQVICIKIILALLSNHKINEFYRFIFSLSADHNNCLTRLRLQSTLVNLAEFTQYIHETGYFGQHVIGLAINDCFNNNPGLIGITEAAFLAWAAKNPDIFSWMPILHRMQSSELVVHNVKCTTCKLLPIIGLRYKCSKCSNYNQCQRCFFSGLTNEKHKITHAMKEHCVEGTSKNYKHALLKRICFLVNCTKSHIVSEPTNAITEAKSIDKNCLQRLNSDQTYIVEPLSSPQLQLQTIIKHLEFQNKELYERLLTCSKNDIKQCIEEHRTNVTNLAQKLKTLKDCLATTENKVCNNKAPSNSSTPMSVNGRAKTVPIDLFSPIAKNMPPIEEDFKSDFTKIRNMDTTENNSTRTYSINDISTWIGGRPVDTTNIKTNEFEMDYCDEKYLNNHTKKQAQNDLDEALAKLQQILANNFVLDESLGNYDNGQLKCAVTEVEGMLTSLIDNVESAKVPTNQFKEIVC